MSLDLGIDDDFVKFTAIELMVSIEKISIDTAFRKISTWSSLNALVYISRINEETGVLISTSDLMNAETIQDIYQLVLKRKS